MVRTDALSTLKAEAVAADYFAADVAVAYGVAHGCLDVLGALEAEGGGTLAQMVLPGAVAVAVQGRNDGLLRVRSLQVAAAGGGAEVIVPVSDLREKPADGVARWMMERAGGRSEWAMGIVALAYLLEENNGATVLIHGDLPMGAGQASSTALLTAFGMALGELRRRGIDTLALAQLTARAEALAASTHLPPAPPSRGHIIDAITCMHPRHQRPTLLRYSAQPHRFVGPVPLPGDVRVFALDTGVRHSRARDTLEELRIAAAMGQRIIETIYRDLGQPHTPLHGHLTNTSPLLYRQYFRTLLPRRLRGSDFVRTYGPLPEGLIHLPREELDTARVYRVRTAVDHLIAENEHAEQFLQAMEELADAGSGPDAVDDAERQRTLQRAGRLLLASHHSYRLRLELSCREADLLVDCLMEGGPERGVFGARITGCGGGGTVVALLDKSAAATDVLLRMIRTYHQQTGRMLGVTEV